MSKYEVCHTPGAKICVCRKLPNGQTEHLYFHWGPDSPAVVRTVESFVWSCPEVHAFPKNWIII